MEDEQEIILHSLSADQFNDESPPMIPYVHGQSVTRANFIDMIAGSFAFSRGNPNVQRAYLLWLEARIGFDFRKTLRNFQAAGSWGCLNVQEQNYFTELMKSVGKHKDEEQEISGRPSSTILSFLKDPGKMFNGEIDGILSEEDMNETLALCSGIDLNTITLRDLQKRSVDWY